MQSVQGDFTCPSDYPGATCECLSILPVPEMKWDWCANEGGRCACETHMRFGATGTNDMYVSGYFDANPDVVKWVQKPIVGDVGMTACSAGSFEGGIDPFPGQVL